MCSYLGVWKVRTKEDTLLLLSSYKARKMNSVFLGKVDVYMNVLDDMIFPDWKWTMSLVFIHLKKFYGFETTSHDILNSQFKKIQVKFEEFHLNFQNFKDFFYLNWNFSTFQ